MRLRDDGEAAVVVDHLDEDAHAASFEETFVGKPFPVQVSRNQLPQAVPDTFSTGWDFTNHGLSYTNISVYRDLHCWEMRFNWIPIGSYKSWNFTINVKAAALKDLKLTKKKDYRDN